MTTYKGAQTYIRPITYDDTDLIVKWRNQDNVRRYFFFREDFTEEMHLNWMKTKVETGEVVQFIICNIDDGRPIGCTYYRDIDINNGTAEYGVFLGEENARGHGIGKEVLALTLKYGWEKLGLTKVTSRAILTNDASVQSFLHSGFAIDSVVHDVPCSDGEKTDMVLMSIGR